MKFSAETSSIVTAVQRASIAVSRKATTPLLLNLLLTADAKGVKVYGTDMVIGSTARCVADVKTEGVVAVDQQRFLDILSNLPGKKKTTFTLAGDKLKVACGKAVYNLLIIDPQSFPPPIRPAGKKMEIQNFLLAELIRWTEHAMSTDETRAHLFGARFTLDKKKATMIATDSRRLVVGSMKNKSKEPFTAFVPYPSIAAIKKFCDAVQEAEVMFSMSGTHLFFWTDTAGMSSKLVDAKPMDYLAVLPKSSKTDVSFKRSVVQSALTRLRVISDDPVRLFVDVDNNSLEITSSNPLAGEGKESIPIGFTGQQCEVLLSITHLQDALGVMSSEVVDVLLNTSRDPVIVKPRDETDLTMLLMPLDDRS